jgi:hypothetical protein
MVIDQAICTSSPFMLSIEKCHEILNSSNNSFTKEEARIIRECLYNLAGIASNEFTSKDNGNNRKQRGGPRSR